MGWSDLIGDGLGSVATEMFGPAFTKDNSIDTCQPGEAEVRISLILLIYSFLFQPQPERIFLDALLILIV